MMAVRCWNGRRGLVALIMVLLMRYRHANSWVSPRISPRLSRDCQRQYHFAVREKEAPEVTPDDSIIPILYESDRLLIVNKPPGKSHHNEGSSSKNREVADEDGLEENRDDDTDLGDSSSGNEDGTSTTTTMTTMTSMTSMTTTTTLGMVNLVRRQYGRRLWGVHRLDRVTSGILVFAKDAAMAQALTASFASGTIQKVYLGVSAKRPTKKKQGWVQGGMARSRDKSWKLVQAAKQDLGTGPTTKRSSKNFAKTRFFTAPFLLDGRRHKMTLLLFRPYTGKTHQLRVAAKSMGMPLWGDPIYKDGSSGTAKITNNPFQTKPSFEGSSELDDSLPQAPRTCLHASGILIPPLLNSQEPVAVWCPPPFDDVVDEQAVATLMRKHCDVGEILACMEDFVNATLLPQ